jgi:hypothetical protein
VSDLARSWVRIDDLFTRASQSRRQRAATRTRPREDGFRRRHWTPGSVSFRSEAQVRSMERHALPPMGHHPLRAR